MPLTCAIVACLVGLGAETPVSAARASILTRPAGLVQAGNSKTACIYAGLATTLITAEHATGMTYNCVETFSNADPTWADWVSPWLTHVQYGYGEWLAAAPRKRTVIITQNLIPDSEKNNPNWRAEGAAGMFNKYARALAQELVASGFGYSVIRLGHEMNGIWDNDTIGTNPGQWRQWARYFAQIVKTMRVARGAHFLFDWNVLAGYRDIRLGDYYPGDRYVDIVGIDQYDEGADGPLPPTSSPSRWHDLVNEPLGLVDVYRFAQKHGKALSIPEWGTVNSPDNGDDGAYVAHMGHFITTHDVAYQSWFDAGDDGIYPLTATAAPHSLAAYVARIARPARVSS